VGGLARVGYKIEPFRSPKSPQVLFPGLVMAAFRARSPLQPRAPLEGCSGIGGKVNCALGFLGPNPCQGIVNRPTLAGGNLRPSFSRLPQVPESSVQGDVTADVILVNPVPTRTPWASVLVERRGFDNNVVPPLGKVLAGLNAKAKERRLGIYMPMGQVESRPPKYTL